MLTSQLALRSFVTAALFAGSLMGAASAQDLRRILNDALPSISGRNLSEEELRQLLKSSGQPVNKFILGIAVQPLQKGMHVHLPIPEGQGVLIQHLQAGGPAEAAGIQQYDILLELNGKPLTGPADLISRLAETNDAPVKLLLFRKGERFEKTVTPTVRDESKVAETLAPARDPEQLGVQRLPNLEGESFRLIYPGMMYAPPAPQDVEQLRKDVAELKAQQQELLKRLDAFLPAQGKN